MTKVAVVFAEGFEEIEALSPVDVFRRAGFDCNMLGLESASVTCLLYTSPSPRDTR